MAFKHTATYDGATFTRTSQGRTYTHCIVRIRDLAQRRKECEEGAREYWRRNVGYMQEQAAGKHPWKLIAREDHHPQHEVRLDDAKWEAYVAQVTAENVRRIKDAQAWLAAGEDGLVAEYLESFDKRPRQMASDGKHYYAGGDEWCGRPDLADAAIGKWFKRGVTAVAVPATFVETKPRAKK